MKFVNIFKSEATNPNTGEVVEGIRVRTDSGRVFKVRNTFEELKAFGTVEEVLEGLDIVNGIYGEYAALPRYTKKEDLSW